jgi:hypothetical protein
MATVNDATVVVEPRLPLTFVVSLASLLLLAFGGGWTLIQTQFNNTEKSIEASARVADVAFKNAVDLVTLERQQTRFELNQLSKDLTEVHNQLRHDVVRTPEFKQFEERLSSVVKRLDIVETTRPTTGELKATAESANVASQILGNRLGQLEVRAYDLAARGARNPVESGEIASINKQMELVQQQISDINRQMAAMLLTIGGATKLPIANPPTR